MDSPELDAASIHAALRGLARLNTLSRAAADIWGAIRPATRAGESLTLLDIATGSADVPVGVAERARRAGVPIELLLCDQRAEMRDAAARRAADAGIAARTFAFDALAGGIDVSADVVTTSLFTHHLSDTHIVGLLRWMKSAARRMIVISDLVRSRRNLALVWLATRAVTRSRIVHADGPLSVRAALTPSEFTELAEEAGLRAGSIRTTPFCRFVYTWRADAR